MANTLWFALNLPAIETELDISGSVISVNLDIPAIELGASISQGAVLNFPLEVPVLEVSATIKSGEKLSASLPMPAVKLSFRIAPRNEMDASLDIPAIEVSLQIIHTKIDAALVIPALRLSGGIKSGNIFRGEIDIPALKLSGTVISGSLVSGAIKVPTLELSGTLISGGILSGAIEIPALTLSATFVHQNQLVFALDIPFIDPWLEIKEFQAFNVALDIPAFVSTRKGFVMNLSHFGVTDYSGYSFNSFCDYHGLGMYIGASEQGIFLLDGDDDAGVRIDSAIQTGTEDLWRDVIKRLREGWIVKRGGPISIQLILDEGRIDPITRVLNTNGTFSGEERVKFPRGLKNRFMSFVIRNLDGADFDLESFRAMVDPITHRKR